MLGFRSEARGDHPDHATRRGGKLTIIMLESDDVLSDEGAEGLAKLGADVALALDSSAFKEDMLVQRSEARFRSLVQNSTDVVVVVKPDGEVQYQSPSGERVLGYPDAELLGTNLRQLIHRTMCRSWRRSWLMWSIARRRRRASSGASFMPGGSWVHTETTGNNLLDDPHVSGLVLNSRDIGNRGALQDQLSYQAFHDPLTTLPNRALFMDQLDHAWMRAERRGQPVPMFFLDLDYFKIVNDRLGHQAGDQLLIEAAQRLLECVRTEDTVARLEGDEFTILIQDIQGLESALEVALWIAFKLRTPFSIVGHEVFSTASVGSCGSRTSRSCRWSRWGSTGWRRWCAGSIQRGGLCRRPTPFPLLKRLA